MKESCSTCTYCATIEEKGHTNNYCLFYWQYIENPNDTACEKFDEQAEKGEKVG